MTRAPAAAAPGTLGGKPIRGAVALVTGANRGIGRALVDELRRRGAARVYACARDPATLAGVGAEDPDRIVVLTLDVTDPAAVTRAAAAAPDVDLVVNNAGVLASAAFIAAPTMEPARTEMETNVFGTLAMVRAFAPVLAANGGGAIVNLLSIAAHISMPWVGSYSASKAAAWSMTQGVRAELAAQGTLVVGVFPGPVDTAMAESLAGDKASPAAVAERVLTAVEDGTEDVYPDAYAQSLRDKLARDYKAIEKKLAALLAQSSRSG